MSSVNRHLAQHKSWFRNSFCKVWWHSCTLCVWLPHYWWTGRYAMAHKYFNLTYEGFPVITTLAGKMCEENDAQNLCKNTCRFFGGLGSRRPIFLQKKKKWRFLVKSVLKLELWNMKSQFSFKLLVFLGHDIKNMCPSFLWTINSYFILGKLSC